MTLIKTSVLTAISTIIKVLSGFVINKVLSIYVGPSGLAIVGQLRDFLSTVLSFSNGAITSGVVKYTAEYQTIEEKEKIFSTSIMISLVCSLIVAVLVFIFSDYLTVKILKTEAYVSVFQILAFTIVLFSLNTLLQSILNGQKEIKKYIMVNISSSIFSLFFTSFLVYKFHLLGALYAIVLNQSVIFFVTLSFVIKSNWFKVQYFIQGVDRKSLKKLSKFSLMAITSALTIPISYIIVRNYIGENLSWDDAGYFQGIKYISDMYLLVITASLRVYYLPKLSEIQDKKELKKEIITGYKIIMPIVTVLAFSIYTFRDLAISIAFSKEFIPMKGLFLWQLVGDVVKITSWLIGYLLVAKAFTGFFIIKEIFISVIFVLFGIFFIKNFGLVGITYAFTLIYIINFIIIYSFIQYKKVLK